MQFTSNYDSWVIIYERKMFIRLATDLFVRIQLLWFSWMSNIFTCLVKSKPVNQGVSHTVILPLTKLVSIFWFKYHCKTGLQHCSPNWAISPKYLQKISLQQNGYVKTVLTISKINFYLSENCCGCFWAMFG